MKEKNQSWNPSVRKRVSERSRCLVMSPNNFVFKKQLRKHDRVKNIGERKTNSGFSDVDSGSASKSKLI
jgi:hypothetical protein